MKKKVELGFIGILISLFVMNGVMADIPGPGGIFISGVILWIICFLLLVL